MMTTMDMVVPLVLQCHPFFTK